MQWQNFLCKERWLIFEYSCTWEFKKESDIFDATSYPHSYIVLHVDCLSPVVCRNTFVTNLHNSLAFWLPFVLCVELLKEKEPTCTLLKIRVVSFLLFTQKDRSIYFFVTMHVINFAICFCLKTMLVYFIFNTKIITRNIEMLF